MSNEVICPGASDDCGQCTHREEHKYGKDCDLKCGGEIKPCKEVNVNGG